MDDLMKELYTCLPRLKPIELPEREKALEEWERLSGPLTEKYGVDFVDRLVSLRADIDGYDGIREFCDGLRLGICLRLELEG